MTHPRLRIVHCFRSPVGGIFRHVRDLTLAQAEAGHDVGIVCDSTTGGVYEDRLFSTLEGKVPLGIHRTPMQRHIGIGDLGAAWRSFQVIRQLEPDVLHGHGAKGGVYARLFGSAFRVSRSRVARIYTPHGGSLHYDQTTVTGRVFFALEALMGRFTDQLIFVSDYERRTYLNKVGRPSAPFELVHNGLRDDEFIPVATLPDAADFLYVGMMRDLKGPDLFIEALGEAAARSDRRLTAVMVGDGDDLPRYREMAEALSPSIEVRFHAAMPAREAFTLGRTMVVPSRAEAMPYIVLEALAAGKPLIATAVGGIPEILGETSAALTAPNAAAIAARMCEALDDEEAFKGSMPSAAELKTRFGAEIMAERIERAYLRSLS